MKLLLCGGSELSKKAENKFKRRTLTFFGRVKPEF
jgi:hypothetical protein